MGVWPANYWGWIPAGNFQPGAELSNYRRRSSSDQGVFLTAIGVAFSQTLRSLEHNERGPLDNADNKCEAARLLYTLHPASLAVNK